MRITSLACLAIVALAAATAVAPVANATRSAISPAHASSASVTHVWPTKLRTCVDQSDDDTSNGIVSQNFERSFDTFDSRGADDFTLAKTCHIKLVMVDGQYFAGSGPASSENVTFYRNMGGAVGGVISNQVNLKGEDDGAGNFTIMLNSSVGLRPGTYWVSVQANLNFGTGGQWGWNTNSTQRGKPDVWRNKLDGFGFGCVRYTVTSACISNGQGPDFSFLLQGSGPGSH